MDGKTAVLIGHRISTLIDADIIMLFDNGKLVEQGSHEELIKNGAFYSELYLKQLVEGVEG
jgi:ATP-binding cassette subfamily B protein